MSNCGCNNSTPCTSQECGCKFEVDAGCVRYTGDTLSCIDAQTGDLLADILLELNNKFCDLTNGNFIEVSQEIPGNSCVNGGLKIVVKDINTSAIISTEYLCTAAALGSVTGLNTDNTDPLNPVVRISVDGTTVTGLGTPASPLVATGGVAGSGTQDYIARWTPNGNTLGTGTIQDNGLTAGVNGLVSNIDFVVGGTAGSTYAFLAEVVAGSLAAIKGQAVDPSATVNTAIAAIATNQSTGGSIGGKFNVNGLTTGTGDAIGIKVLSEGTLVTKYSAQLQDGTEGVGKVLTSVTADGKANWTTPLAGSGTNNYVSRWTPDGNTLGTGLLRDDNSSVSIGVAPDAGAKLAIQSDKGNGLYILQTVNGYGLNARSIAAGGTSNAGGLLWAGNSTTQNVGAEIVATGGTTSTNIGITTQVYGGATNYAAKLSDGTEGLGKVLTCITADGKTNWDKVTSTYTTGASGSFTSNDGKTITVTNGLITSIV